MNKFTKTIFTSLLIMILISISIYIVLINFKGDAIEDLVKYSYETPEITTDLKDGSFVRVQFHIVTDGKKARREISKRDFQLKNILIKELSLLGEKEFTTELDQLESIVRDKINELMTEGKILEVYTIHKILQ